MVHLREVSSSSSESESAFKPQEVKEPNELHWFHTGAKVHITAFLDDNGKEVPKCRELEGIPFIMETKSKGVGWSDEIDHRGLCSRCSKAWA